VTNDDNKANIITHLMEKSDRALSAARREYDAGDYGAASNRVYYACFYAVSAVLLNENQQFQKHSSLRAAMHKHLVKTGRIPPKLGKFFDRAFFERQEADYNALAKFEQAMLTERLHDAELFVAEMKRLLA